MSTPRGLPAWEPREKAAIRTHRDRTPKLSPVRGFPFPGINLNARLASKPHPGNVQISERELSLRSYMRIVFGRGRAGELRPKTSNRRNRLQRNAASGVR